MRVHWDRLVTGLAAVGIVWLALKYGGSIIDFFADLTYPHPRQDPEAKAKSISALVAAGVLIVILASTVRSNRKDS